MKWLKEQLQRQAGNAPFLVKVCDGVAGGVLVLGLCKMLGVSAAVANPVPASVAAIIAFTWQKR